MDASQLDPMIPEVMDPEDWSSIPLGPDARGDAVCTDLRDDSAILVVGPIAVQRIALSMLSRGHNLVSIDVSEQSDLFGFRDWLVAEAQTPLEATKVIVQVFTELDRRQDVLAQHGAATWTMLSKSIRKKEGIRPLTVVVTGLDHTPVEEEDERSGNARVNLPHYVRRLASVARAFGIYVVVAVESADASSLTEGFIVNLTSRVLPVNPLAMPPEQTISLLFKGRETEILEKSNLYSLGPITRQGKPARGLGVLGTRDGSITAFQIAPVSSRDVAEVLEEIGVPKPEKWQMND